MVLMGSCTISELVDNPTTDFLVHHNFGKVAVAVAFLDHQQKSGLGGDKLDELVGQFPAPGLAADVHADDRDFLSDGPGDQLFHARHFLVGIDAGRAEALRAAADDNDQAARVLQVIRAGQGCHLQGDLVAVESALAMFRSALWPAVVRRVGSLAENFTSCADTLKTLPDARRRG